ncbi:hypothetical protein ACNF42_07595 [Cuniculiplasma sp. SKW3]|uniref:hypothetical protein n=1 Tax=unclassified Cuniculiplasma TaxID=2619706 RepID=UPI003FD1CB6A
MGFNGINGDLNVPGMIPWEIIVAYFLIALGFVIFYSMKTGGLKGYKTVDFVYIGIGAAFTVVWEFFVGPLLDKIVPPGLSAFIGFGFFGRIIVLFIVAGLVRKPGVGMLSLAIFDILGDIFHYGFSGEPVFVFYEALTYGLFIDLAITIKRGNLFGNLKDKSNKSNIGAAITGAIIGFTWAFPDPFFYKGFFGPFLYGSIVNWQKILISFYEAIPGNIILGIIAGLIALRVSRVLVQ